MAHSTLQSVARYNAMDVMDDTLGGGGGTISIRNFSTQGSVLASVVFCKEAFFNFELSIRHSAAPPTVLSPYF